MAKAKREIPKQMQEGAQLDKRIKQNLRKIGVEI